MQQINKIITSAFTATILSGSILAQDPPNFVIVLADDCSYIDLGCYGSDISITPNINALAKQGIKFNHCYQATAMSSPTRHCLYTGLYPVRSGAYPNHTFVYDNVKSFVQYFKTAGYNTALYGKEHVNPKEIFAYEFLGNYSEGKMDFDAINNYIKSVKGNPFVLVIASNEPHPPFNCGNTSLWDKENINLPGIYVDTPEMRDYYIKYLAEINKLDQEVGKIQEIIKDNDIEKNTVFIFLSEQGNEFPFAKWTCYNLGLQSACIIKYPDVINADTESNAIVEYVDIVPTMLDIANIKFDKNDFDGISFKKVLFGKTDKHKDYAFGVQTSRGIVNGPEFYGIRSINDNRYRYIYNLTPDAEFKSITLIRDYWLSMEENAKGDEKKEALLNRYRFRPQIEFYDMEKDLYNEHNLAEDPQYFKIMNKMHRKLLRWMKSQGDAGQETELMASERQTSNF